MNGYRRHGPRFTWTNWWGHMLIRTEEDDEETMRAEDEAIAAMEAGPQPAPSDITTLMEALTGGREVQADGLAQPDRWDGHRGA